MCKTNVALWRATKPVARLQLRARSLGSESVLSNGIERCFLNEATSAMLVCSGAYPVVLLAECMKSTKQIKQGASVFCYVWFWEQHLNASSAIPSRGDQKRLSMVDDVVLDLSSTASRSSTQSSAPNTPPISGTGVSKGLARKRRKVLATHVIPHQFLSELRTLSPSVTPTRSASHPGPIRFTRPFREFHPFDPAAR